MTETHGSYLHNQNFRDYSSKAQIDNDIALTEHDKMVRLEIKLSDAYSEIARLRAIIAQLGG